jgi:hypothetical protein
LTEFERAELRQGSPVHSDPVERLNSEGIPRDHLKHALRNKRLVRDARRINSCLLCRRIGVNEAGICEVCYSLLNDEEQRLAEAWIRGGGP